MGLAPRHDEQQVARHAHVNSSKYMYPAVDQSKRVAEIVLENLTILYLQVLSYLLLSRRHRWQCSQEPRVVCLDTYMHGLSQTNLFHAHNTLRVHVVSHAGFHAGRAQAHRPPAETPHAKIGLAHAVFRGAS